MTTLFEWEPDCRIAHFKGVIVPHFKFVINSFISTGQGSTMGDYLFQGVTSEVYSTLIYSVTGELMYSDISNSETINISTLPSGIYFLEISTSEGNKQLQKFIKH
jgi:hypothetical protein